jgi:hypothetical protein
MLTKASGSSLSLVILPEILKYCAWAPQKLKRNTTNKQLRQCIAGDIDCKIAKIITPIKERSLFSE